MHVNNWVSTYFKIFLCIRRRSDLFFHPSPGAMESAQAPPPGQKSSHLRVIPSVSMSPCSNILAAALLFCLLSQLGVCSQPILRRRQQRGAPSPYLRRSNSTCQVLEWNVIDETQSCGQSRVGAGKRCYAYVTLC